MTERIYSMMSVFSTSLKVRTLGEGRKMLASFELKRHADAPRHQPKGTKSCIINPGLLMPG